MYQPVKIDENRASSTLIAKLPPSLPASTSRLPLIFFEANRPDATEIQKITSRSRRMHFNCIQQSNTKKAKPAEARSSAPGLRLYPPLLRESLASPSTRSCTSHKQASMVLKCQTRKLKPEVQRCLQQRLFALRLLPGNAIIKNIQRLKTLLPFFPIYAHACFSSSSSCQPNKRKSAVHSKK
jgi:hypothetical protein